MSAHTLFAPVLIVLFLLMLAVCGKVDSSAASKTAAGPAPAAGGGLPRLLDLGADKCIPCKMMAPILEELDKEYAGRLKVEFIDVWKDKEKAAAYGVRMIPTQIFYGVTGQELFRRTGFTGKEDILAKWRELGYDFE